MPSVVREAAWLGALWLSLGQPALALSLGSINNFRDLGTVPCRGAKAVKPGLIYRAASPAAASSEDAQALQQRLRTIIDLRSEADAADDVGPRLLSSMTTHVELLNKKVVKKNVKRLMLRQPLHSMPFLLCALLKKLLPPLVSEVHDRITTLMHDKLRHFIRYIELTDVYFWILTHHGESLRQAILLCAESSAQPVMVHCTHGKDRTGVLVALLLHICGASPQTIASEYALSDDWGCSLEGRAAMLRAMPPKLQDAIENAEQFGEWCSAPERAMLELWRRVDRRFGSMDAYLDSIGITASTRARIADSLTVPTSDGCAEGAAPQAA